MPVLREEEKRKKPKEKPIDSIVENSNVYSSSPGKELLGNVQPLRNAQRWEGGIHFVTERYWRGRGVQVIPLRNADKISQLVFI